MIKLKLPINNIQSANNQSGQVLVLALIVLAFVVVNTILIISGSLTFSQNSRYTVDETQAISLAEAGVDKTVATLNASGGSLSNINNNTEVPLNPGSYEVAVTTLNSSTYLIQSTGYIPNKQKPVTKKTVSIKVTKGDGFAFNYGTQVGEGGFTMSGGTQILGSVYSNGDINLSGGARINGDAIVAGGTQPIADQQAACSNPNCVDFTFGKTANNQLDIAQSFKPTTSAVVNKVSLNLKKVGSPANITVRILADNNGSPSKNTVLTSGTLNASLVTTNYSYVDVAFATNPTLNANTTYWIVLDTSANSSNYWLWRADSLQGYTRGAAKWAPDWSAGNPSWNAISSDLDFKVFMGGQVTRIAGTGSSFINGNARANTLTADNSSALQIGQHAYYQNQVGITVNGSSCTNNPNCHPNSADPVPLVLPISDSNITDWKNQSVAGGVITGDQNFQFPCTQVLQNKKYVGNVTIGGGCTINADSPVWITGNLTISSGATLKLKSSYGDVSGIIVTDGKIALSGGSRLQGSGTAGSYMLALSTYNSPGGDGDSAIVANGGNSSSILYAKDGNVTLSGGANLREITAKRLILNGGAQVTYESGVASPVFSSGPSGSFTSIKGTYQVK